MAEGLEGCVEGCIVTVSMSGSVLHAYVKGYLHPGYSLIIQPYRGPDCDRPYHPPLRYVACIGRRTAIANYREVVGVLDPPKVLLHRFTQLPIPIKRMLMAAPIDWAGLTGSHAVGCSNSQSDVDLLVYTDAPEELLKWILRERNRGIIRQCGARRIRMKRVGRPDYSATLNHITTSPVESCYGGVPYTLRILRSLNPRRCVTWEATQIPLGTVRVRGDLKVDPVESILVPARYRLRVARSNNSIVDRGDIVVVESFRTRYAWLRKGTYIIEGEVFLDVDSGSLKISPDLVGSVWRVGE